MIKKVWIILMIDRTRLGSPVCAVAEARSEDDRSPLTGLIRRTARLNHARRFPSWPDAASFAASLGRREPVTLFAPIEVREGDFVRPRWMPLGEFTLVQSTLFETEEVPR